MTEIVIVGGGIAGLSLAAALAPAARVTLIEAEEALGTQASGRSAAMFLAGYGNAAVQALNRASEPAHRALGVLSPRGVLLLAGPGEEALFEAALAEGGVAEIAPAEARARVPVLDTGHIRRAGRIDGAEDIDTDRLLQHCARTARAAGAALRTRAGLRAATRRAGRWRIETAAGPLSADILVNAAGAWADRVAEAAGARPLGLRPLRRSVARMPAPGGHDVARWPMLLGAGERWYAKPDAGRWLVSPAEEDPVDPHDAWAEDMVLAEGIARYQPFVTAPVTRVETSWAGLRTFAADRTPVIGPDPSVEGFFWLAGQGGYGFQIAPAAAALAAALLTGRCPALPPGLLETLSPARFGAAQTNSGTRSSGPSAG